MYDVELKTDSSMLKNEPLTIWQIYDVIHLAKYDSLYES